MISRLLQEGFKGILEEFKSYITGTVQARSSVQDGQQNYHRGQKKRNLKNVEWYKCHSMGHYTANSPNRVSRDFYPQGRNNQSQN